MSVITKNTAWSIVLKYYVWNVAIGEAGFQKFLIFENFWLHGNYSENTDPCLHSCFLCMCRLQHSY